ncbi:MAG: hypothetical protein JST22_18360 [Bacteroidetes bacterium]|nr:hypothetical protein [Bacteroidota bacterium]
MAPGSGLETHSYDSVLTFVARGRERLQGARSESSRQEFTAAARGFAGQLPRA